MSRCCRALLLLGIGSIVNAVNGPALAGGVGGGTYYIKPHAPENAVIKVKIKGVDDPLTPDMDHKYWLDAYWDAEYGVTVELIYVTENGYFFIDGSGTITKELTITTNGLEIDPPADTETVRAQAQSGNSYYRTLREAIEESSDRAKISLMGDLTLEETLVVTNAVTLDLDANVVTLGSDLTEAFRFTANVTVANGTINSSLAANVAGSRLLRFTDCKGTLRDLTINGRGYECVVAHDTATTASDKYSTRRMLDALAFDNLVVTGNGCLLWIDYATATLTNSCTITFDDTFGTFGDLPEAAIYCSGNGKVTVASGTYVAPKALQSGDFGGKIIVNGGTFCGQICSAMQSGAHSEFEQYANYKAQFTFNGGNYANATVGFVDADSRGLDVFTKNAEVVIAAPDGYVWEPDGSADTLVQGTQPDPITAGVQSEPYADALSATNAAAKVNANKANAIVVPDGVADAVKTTYLTRIAATVTDENRIVVELTAAGAEAEQAIVDAAVLSEAAVSALTSSNASAKVTIATTTPGLYYWIMGGEEASEVTVPGSGVLSTDGGTVVLNKPTLNAANGKAFFRIAAGVRSPE